MRWSWRCRVLGLAMLLAMAAAAVGSAASDQASPLPLERFSVESSPQLGPAGAPVTLVEFADFQCMYCARGARTVRRLVKHYRGQVRWVFKHFPLRPNPDVDLPHVAAVAALEQGRFWEIHEVLFANQGHFGRGDLIRYAEQLQLDRLAFAKGLRDRRLGSAIARDVELARSLGVTVTPTYFINGRRLVGAQPFSHFQQIIDQELAASAGGPGQ